MKSAELLWKDDSGNVYQFFSNPMTYSVVFVLLLEACERFTYYGLSIHFQRFMTGDYAGGTRFSSSDMEANIYLFNMKTVMMITPLLAGVVADSVLGVFKTQMLFALLYMGGIACFVASTYWPAKWLVDFAMFGLFAFGAGGIKACVNVLGAQQFHPEVHKDLVAKYYGYFYASINVGSLITLMLTPCVVAKAGFTTAFAVCLSVFVVGTLVVGIMAKRYVMIKPQGSVIVGIVKVLASATFNMSFESTKKSLGGLHEDFLVEDTKALLRLTPLFCANVPFLVAYNQMEGPFVTQAKKMDGTIFGYEVPAESIQCANAVLVILGGLLIDALVYAPLRRRGRMPTMMQRLGIGNLLGICGMFCAYGVERVLIGNSAGSVSLFWQVPQFAFVAFGELFAISTAYDMAFTHSPRSLKTFSSAYVLLFFSFSNILSNAVASLFADWCPDYNTQELRTQELRDAAVGRSQYDLYYLVLAGICLFGVVLCGMLNPYYVRVKRSIDELNAKREQQALEEVAC